MRRPTTLFTGAFLVGIYLVPHFHMIFLLPLILGGYFLYRQKLIKIALIGILMGLLFMGANSGGDFSKEGKEITLHGTAVEETKGKSLVLHTKEEGRVLVYIDKDIGEVIKGKEVSLTGEIKVPREKTNPGGFDYLLYLKGRGIDLVVNNHSLEIGKVKNPLLYQGALLKDHFLIYMNKYMKEESVQLTMAMTFGDKTQLKEETYTLFQRNGVAHILAASGLHVGILYGAILFFFRGKRRIFVNGAIFLVLLFYMIIIGETPSIQRAIIMIGIYMIAQITCRRYDLLTGGCLAAIVLLAQNPWPLFSIGFQLSFFAILIIAISIPYLREIQSLWKRTFVFLLILQLTMAPITSFYFYQGTPMGVFANIPNMILIGVFLPLALLTTILANLFPHLNGFFAYVLDIMCGWFLQINTFFFHQGEWSFLVVPLNIGVIFLLYGMGILLFSEGGRIWKGRKEWGKIGGVVLLTLIISLCLSFNHKDPLRDCPVICLDVGQGSCLFFTTPEGKSVLIDGGGNKSYDVGEKVLKPFLLSRGIKKIDLAIVSHLDEDHYGGIRSLCNLNMVKYLGVSPYCGKNKEDLAEECSMKEEDIFHLRKGDILYEEDDFSVVVLGPAENHGEGNESSLVLKISYGAWDLLSTGDIGEDTEKELVDLWKEEMEAEVVLAPHHGSKYSSSSTFMDGTKAKYCIIQVGKNNYGHPNKQVIENYEEKGIIVYRNDNNGAVGLCPDNEKIITYR